MSAHLTASDSATGCVAKREIEILRARRSLLREDFLVHQRAWLVAKAQKLSNSMELSKIREIETQREAHGGAADMLFANLKEVDERIMQCEARVVEAEQFSSDLKKK